MANEFIIKNGFFSQGDSQITGSLNITGGITGSFSGSLSAPGATTQIVYNNGGVLGANSGFVYSGSRVGIGTNTPSQSLDLRGSMQISGSIFPFADSVSYLGDTALRFTLVYARGLNAVGNSLDIAGSNINLNDSAGNVLARITGATGNVGIGMSTTTPTSRLQVRGSGTTNATTALRVENTNASASLVVRDDGRVGIGTSTPNTALEISGANDKLRFTNTSSGGQNFSIGPSILGVSNGGFSIRDLTNSVDRIVIGETGTVGIGTSTPTSQLHISGASSATLLEIDSPSVNNILFVSGSGNVGIGTNNPSTPLHISGSSSSPIKIILQNSAINSQAGIDFIQTTQQTRLITTVTKPFFIYDQTTQLERFTLLPNGNIGIGNPSPSASLHISGASSAALLRVDSPASSSILFVSGSGNVGIRTNTPLYPLDVSGSARFKFTPSGTDLFTIDGASTTRYFIVENGNGYVGIGSGYTTSTIPTTPIDIRGNTSVRGGSSTIGNAFTVTNFTPITLFTVQNNGQVSFTSPTIALATSQSAFTISQSISASNVVGGQYYGVNITPTFFATTSSQTETALRVAATFTGSVISSPGTNIIADFGATSAGSQFTVTDVTSGSIYMVNDVSGLPIIEATSDWTVNMYNYPNLVFNKTGSQVNVFGTLRVSGSFILPLSQSVSPQTGSAYWSGSLLFVYDGTRYRSSSFA